MEYPLCVDHNNFNLSRLAGRQILKKVVSKSLFDEDWFQTVFVPFVKSNLILWFLFFWHVEDRKFSKNPFDEAQSRHYHGSHCSVQWSGCH